MEPAGWVQAVKMKHLGFQDFGSGINFRLRGSGFKGKSTSDSLGIIQRL